MKSLSDYGTNEDGEALDLVPQRYADGSLALTALLASGETYAVVSVNLASYGIHPGKNAVFIPDGLLSIVSLVDGDYGRTIDYGYDCKAIEFTFNEDAEKIADINTHDNG